MTPPTPPSRSLEERRGALAKSADVRRQRGELLVRLRSESIALAELLDLAMDDDVVGRMKVVDVLEWLPGMDANEASRIRELAGISERKRLRGLSAHQRYVLLKVVTAVEQGGPA